MNLQDISITFAEKDNKVVNELNKHFSDSLNVNVFRCDVSQISEADCVVAPSNSYGIMNDNKKNNHSIQKSINLLLDNIEPRVKNVINSIYYGEQPVGTGFLLETSNERFKFMAHVPVKMYDEDIENTSNAYLAFRALLVCILNHNKVSENKIKSIVCSSFCTDNGIMHPHKAVRQLRVAYGMVDVNLGCSIESADMIKGLL